MRWPQLPEYGCFLRWPQDGQSFIHPDDVSIALQVVPSNRVLRREVFDGTYYHYSYGKLRFRLRPCMWLKLENEGIDIGDQVETVGAGLKRELFVAQIWGMYYVRRKGCILYRLRRGNQKVPNLYSRDQFRLLTEKATVREGHTDYPEPVWDGSGETIESYEEE